MRREKTNVSVCVCACVPVFVCVCVSKTSLELYQVSVAQYTPTWTTNITVLLSTRRRMTGPSVPLTSCYTHSSPLSIAVAIIKHFKHFLTYQLSLCTQTKEEDRKQVIHFKHISLTVSEVEVVVVNV